MRGVVVQLAQQAAAVLAHGVVAAQECGLLVKGRAVGADKDTCEVDDVFSIRSVTSI